MDVSSFLKASRSARTTPDEKRRDKSAVKGASASATPRTVTEEVPTVGQGLPKETGTPGEVVTPSASSATVYSDVTPSGIRVTYTPGDGTKENPRQYTVNGEVVPSVTTVLDTLKKPGLSYWGNKIGVAAMIELVARGLLEVRVDWSND